MNVWWSKIKPLEYNEIAGCGYKIQLVNAKNTAIEFIKYNGCVNCNVMNCCVQRAIVGGNLCVRVEMKNIYKLLLWETFIWKILMQLWLTHAHL